MINVELLIEGAGGKIFEPVVLDGVTWETVRVGAPSKLEFTVLRVGDVSFTEGNRVQLKVNNEKVFMGFIFSKSHNKDQQIKCVAYDQLRYFKNKDTYVYTNKTASEVLKMIAADFGLTTGEIADTGFKIKQRDEDNQSLFDIVLNALDLTLDSTGERYVLYDDFGKITLKNINELTTNLLLDKEAGENFEYESSIDRNTYNKVKVIQEDDKTSARNVYVDQNDEHVQKWGVLQYLYKADKGVNVKSIAATILKAKDVKTRTLQIRNVFGNLKVRAGCSVNVSLDLGDTSPNNEKMLCESVKHTFNADYHTMDIVFYNLKG